MAGVRAGQKTCLFLGAGAQVREGSGEHSGWSSNQHACTKLTSDRRRSDTGAAPSASSFLQPRVHARENCIYPAAPGSLRRGRKGRKQL